MVSRYKNIMGSMKRGFVGILIAVFLFGGVTANTLAEEISFIIQPIYSEAKTRQIFQPLVDYLNQSTSHTFKLVTVKSFQKYWNRIQKGNEFDLVLDAAHFTSYRVKYNGYKVIAKVPDTVTFSLITNSNNLFLDADDLIGKTLVSQSPPSMAAVRLEQMFPNPMRLPVMTTTESATQAIELVQQGRVAAAIVPTPLVNNYDNLNIISTTKPVPHIAFSASPKLHEAVVEEIRRVLVTASNSTKGREMLNKLNFKKFETAENKLYEGYDSLLSHTWGYALVSHP